MERSKHGRATRWGRAAGVGLLGFFLLKGLGWLALAALTGKALLE